MMRAAARFVIRFLAMTPLLLGLAGCFKSAAPLVGEAEAVFPFQTLTIKTPEGETGILKRQDNAYVYSEPDASSPDKEKQQVVRLYQVEEDLYIAQELEEGGEATYILAKKNGDTIVTRSDCQGLDAATLKNAGIIPPKPDAGLFYECVTNNLNSLIALAKSPAVWADHTTTLQIVSIE